MSVRCPHCGREYDITLFQFQGEVRCHCGQVVREGHGESIDGDDFLEKLSREMEIEDEERRIGQLRRMVDRISFLIVSSDYPEVDIEIEKEKLEDACRELFPDKIYLYEMIYGRRFRRLWEQFR